MQESSIHLEVEASEGKEEMSRACHEAHVCAGCSEVFVQVCVQYLRIVRSPRSMKL